MHDYYCPVVSDHYWTAVIYEFSSTKMWSSVHKTPSTFSLSGDANWQHKLFYSAPLFCHILHFQSICHFQWMRLLVLLVCLWSVVVSGSAISQHSALLLSSLHHITATNGLHYLHCFVLSCCCCCFKFLLFPSFSSWQHHDVLPCLVLSCPVHIHLANHCSWLAHTWPLWTEVSGCWCCCCCLVLVPECSCFASFMNFGTLQVYTSSLRHSLLISDFTACLALFFCCFQFPCLTFCLAHPPSLSLSCAPLAATS